MICPVCDTNMRVSEREGVEVQYCPQCGGIWLQRGVLEGIIARVSGNSTQEPRRTKGEERDNHDDQEHDEDQRPSPSGRNRQPNEKERRGEGIREFFGNLFDFG